MFITFEGIDGCGKSTQAKKLADLMTAAGAVLTREPGGWEGAAPLRELVLSGGLANKWSELLLFLLDRCEHCTRVINPALAEGHPVICERYQDSTLAYQSWGRGIPLEQVQRLSSGLSLPKPDYTVYFKIDAAAALKRVCGRGKPDAFEKEGLDFLRKIDAGYAALAQMEPDRWITIECGDDSPDEVFFRLCAELRKRGALS